MILEYERRDGSRNTKIIDLLQLTVECVRGDGLETPRAAVRTAAAR